MSDSALRICQGADTRWRLFAATTKGDFCGDVRQSSRTYQGVRGLALGKTLSLLSKVKHYPKYELYSFEPQQNKGLRLLIIKYPTLK